jgi:hypothetical protein
MTMLELLLARLVDIVCDSNPFALAGGMFLLGVCLCVLAILAADTVDEIQTRRAFRRRQCTRRVTVGNVVFLPATRRR